MRAVGIGVGGCVLTVALGALDQSIVATAMPSIAIALDNVTQLGWIVAAYLLALTALTVPFGKITDRYGSRVVLLGSIVLFVASSMVCALAQNIWELIAARALQGGGGAGLIIGSQSTMAGLLSPRDRGLYSSFVSATNAIAAIAGPVAGAFFVQHLTWRWLFWINLPIGLLAFVICARIPSVRTHEEPQPVDAASLVLVALSATAFVLVCSWSTMWTWNSLQVVIAAIAGFATSVLFVVRERRSRTPLFSQRLTRSKTVRLLNGVIFIVSTSMFCVIVLVPAYVQYALGGSASQAGTLLVPMLVSVSIAGFITANMIRLTGRYRFLMPGGCSLIAAGLGMLAFETQGTHAPSHPALASALAIVGLGIGFCIPTINVVIQNSADPRDLGVAISTIFFSRSIGGAFGATVFWSIVLAVSGGAAHIRPAAFSLAFAVAAAAALAALVVALMVPERPLLTTRPGERNAAPA